MLTPYLNTLARLHKLIAAAIIAATMILGMGLSRFEVNNEVRTFLDSDDVVLERYDNFQDTYGSDSNFFIIVVPDNENVFTPEVLDVILEIGISARDIPYFSGVSSIMESPYQQMPLAQAALHDESAMPRFRSAILESPLYLTRLVARDGRAAAVKVNVSLSDNAKAARREALDAARLLVSEAAEQYPASRITLAGNIAVTESLSEAIGRNTVMVSAATFLLIGLFLAFATQSLVATIASMLVVSMSVVATLGGVAWLGVELTVVVGFVPAAISALAVADTMHLLVGYHSELQLGRDKLTAVQNSMRTNTRAILITSITSVAGVLMLNFSEAPPYREMGNMIALGIVIAYAMTMLLWPALMIWFPAPRKTPALLNHQLLSGLGRTTLKYRRALLLGVGSICVLLIVQNQRNALTERWHEYLGPHFEARIATDTVVEYFGGLHHVYFSLDSAEPDGVFDIEYLNGVAAFQSWLASQPEVNHVASIVDAFRAAGFVDNDSDDGQMRVQAKELILTTLNLGGKVPGESSGVSALNADYSASALEVVFKPTDSATLMNTDQRAIAWLNENSRHVSTTGGLGIDLVFAEVNDSNVRSMIFGAGIALLMVTILLIALLRSLKLGLISLIPNVVPIGLAYGVWGMIDGKINMAVSVGMGVCLGLVVNDTVHFLSKYMAAKKDGLVSSSDALLSAFQQVGTAMMISSMVLIVGFSGAFIAEVMPTRQTAAILSMTIGFALLADLFLLTPLLAVFDREAKR